jgi:flagellar capping protein FliD
VDWNYDEIEKKIYEFIIMYNNAMDYFKNITVAIPIKNQKELTEWRKSFEKMTEKEAEEKSFDGTLYKGILNGDITLSSIKMKIREILTKPYQTKAAKEVMFITQLGIENSKYSAGSSTEEEKDNLRAGYLDFNKEKFTKILKDNYDSVVEFFFKDGNGDLIFDEGLAVALSESLKMISSDSFRGKDNLVYPGMIKSRLDMLVGNIKLRQKDIERWDKHVKDYEVQLRAKFTRMYKAMEKSKYQSDKIKNFGSNGQ